MAANFPDSPNTNDTFTSGALTFTWNGSAWKLDPSSGTKGEKGQKGEVGVTGDKGQKGQKGEVGDKGQKGEIGATGDKGQKGEIGSTGGTGGTGAKGQKGEIGATGSGGSAGSDGDKGQKGEVGATGTGTGTADKIFENNTSVECVDTGTGVVEVKVDGTETITVKQGEVGINVSDPKATLDVARTSDNYPAINVSGGNNTYGDLTVESGEILQTGHWNRSTSTFTERFRIGTQGALGVAGSNYGSSGQVLSSQGSSASPQWVDAQNVSGLKGQKGEVGATGSGGAGGDKGQKGEVGTGGSTGAKGDKGEGDKGEKGEVGATGSGGSAGDKGSTGDKGDKGAPSTVAGDKGQKGEIGATGSGGSTGSDGDKGQKGEEGPQGGGAPVGQIVAWSGSAGSLPSGYFLCDGSAVSRTTYAALYTIVGTTHGAGNGSTTFNLPDLRDRFVVGASNSTGDTTYPGVSPGATGGSATDTVTISGSDTVNISVSGSTGFEQLQTGGNHISTGAANRRHTHTFSGSGSDTVNISGSDTVNTLPPYYALAYIIQYAQGGSTAKGQKGEIGATGSGGSTGDKGQKGEAGDKGAASSVQGPSGDKGQKGEVGATGSGGSTGSTGDKGQKGEVSVTGLISMKHANKTSNYAGTNQTFEAVPELTASFTATANSMFFVAFKLLMTGRTTMSGGTQNRTSEYVIRVYKNGSFSHDLSIQTELLPTNDVSNSFGNHPYMSDQTTFQLNGSTLRNISGWAQDSTTSLYSANDTVVIQLYARRGDANTEGTANNYNKVNSGSRFTIFQLESS